MNNLSDADLFAKGTAKLEKAKAVLNDVLEVTKEARQRAKDRKDFDSYQKLARVDAALHTALSGAENACADSFDLQTDEVAPRTGGGGKS